MLTYHHNRNGEKSAFRFLVRGRTKTPVARPIAKPHVNALSANVDSDDELSIVNITDGIENCDDHSTKLASANETSHRIAYSSMSSGVRQSLPPSFSKQRLDNSIRIGMIIDIFL